MLSKTLKLELYLNSLCQRLGFVYGQGSEREVRGEHRGHINASNVF